MVVALATGTELDSILKEQHFKDAKIVPYRELLLKEHFDIVVLSSKLECCTFRIGDRQQMQESVSMNDILRTLLDVGTRIIYITSDIDEARQLVDQGIYDILLEPVKPQQVLNVIKQPMTREQVLNQLNKATLQKKQLPATAEGQVITIWTHDGTRDTAQIAVALAKELLKRHGGRGGLLDFDETTCRIPHMLGVSEVQIESITKLINSGRFASSDILDLLPSWSGLKVFGGVTIKNAFRINQKHFTAIVNSLRQTVNWLVVHAGSGVCTSGVVTAFQMADKILAVTNATTIDVARCIELLDFVCNSWEVSRNKVFLYLINNKFSSEVDATALKDIANQYGFNFAGSGGVKYLKCVSTLVTQLFPKRDKKKTAVERG